MKTIDNLTDKEILEIGSKFKFLRDLNLEISIGIINAIGKSKKESNKLNKIIKEMDSLKSDLENLFWYRLDKMDIDNPLDAFYGKRKESLISDTIEKIINY